MENADFQICEFIENNMCYITYNDFCKKSKQIKKIFKDFNQQQKRFYKWYVYANINMDNYHKNTIWEYLNQDQIDYYLNLLHLYLKNKNK